MTEQQQQHEDPSCAVDLSVSALPEDKKEDDREEVLTTTIEASTTEVMPDVVKAEPQSGFDGFGFSEALLKTLAEKGYSDPSPIQKAAFPELMLGRDLVGQAQTGTGKTAAFALPLLERLESGRKTPQVLVLAPTRELAMQVADSFKALPRVIPTSKFWLFTAARISAPKSARCVGALMWWWERRAA